MKFTNKFGHFWKTHKGGYDWYKWMYDYRVLQHQAFQKWFCFINKLEPVTSVLDIGCGMGVGYVDFFKDINFVGIDLAPRVIKWCKKSITIQNTILYVLKSRNHLKKRNLIWFFHREQ